MNATINHSSVGVSDRLLSNMRFFCIIAALSNKSKPTHRTPSPPPHRYHHQQPSHTFITKKKQQKPPNIQKHQQKAPVKPTKSKH
ncbi:hypothetical protein Hanom_Chr16g01433001 [Helianthus anomalus]